MNQSIQVVVMGLGNLLWADEGFGVRAAEKLYAEYELPDYVDVVDGGTQGFNLLGFVEQASHLLVFDAIDFGHPPGSLHLYQNQAIPTYLSAKKMSLHQNSFSEVLALAQLKDTYPQQVILIGLQPVLLSDYGGSLTKEAKAQLPHAVTMAINQLLAWGVDVVPVSTERRLGCACLSMENYERVRLKRHRLEAIPLQEHDGG